MEREELVALAGKLKLSYDSDINDENLLSLVNNGVDKLVADVEPLRAAAVTAEKRRSMRDEFPDEFARMEKLEARERRADAVDFASRYARFSIKDGDDEKKSTLGFSSLVITNIANLAESISANKSTDEELAAVLDGIAAGGIVDYSEAGSSRHVENQGRGTTHASGDGETQQVRLAFAERVEEIMEQDSLEYGKAVTVAAERYPEDFEDYRSRVPSRNS